jgi:hypothetical protein
MALVFDGAASRRDRGVEGILVDFCGGGSSRASWVLNGARCVTRRLPNREPPTTEPPRDVVSQPGFRDIEDSFDLRPPLMGQTKSESEPPNLATERSAGHCVIRARTRDLRFGCVWAERPKPRGIAEIPQPMPKWVPEVSAPADSMAVGAVCREPVSSPRSLLSIGEEQAPTADLFAEHPVLRWQVLDDILLDCSSPIRRRS